MQFTLQHHIQQFPNLADVVVGGFFVYKKNIKRTKPPLMVACCCTQNNEGNVNLKDPHLLTLKLWKKRKNAKLPAVFMYRCPSIQNESGDTFQICVISCFVLHATFYWIGKLHRRKTCSTCDRNYECNQKRIRSDEDFGWCTAFPFVNVKSPTLNGKIHPEVLAVGLCSSTQIATMLLLYFFFLTC